MALFIIVGKIGGLLREVLMIRSFGVAADGTLTTDAFLLVLAVHVAIGNAWKIAMPQALIPGSTPSPMAIGAAPRSPTQP